MIYDLTMNVEEGMPRIPILPEYRFEPVTLKSKGAPLEIHQLHLATHIGTHMDAPSHAILNGKTIDQVPLEQTYGEGVVIGLECGEGQEITLDQVKASGPEIRSGDVVLLNTGWAKRVADDSYHMNPYFSEELAWHLVEKKVKFVGLDCITVDMPVKLRPQGFNFPIHNILLGHDVLIVENLTNMDEITGKRVKVSALPLRVKGSDAGHARVVVEPL